MDDAFLAQTIRDYGAGLEVEMDLLREVGVLAAAQRAASAGTRLADVARLGDERERLLAQLVRLEHDLRPQRELIVAHLARASAFAGFPPLAARHRDARDLVDTILGADEATIVQLQDAEHARRASVQAIETGEATLAAYRRVVAPLLGTTLVSRRG